MKGLILSGGRGTRLRPITYTSAKQLVPVANKPILFYGIEALAASGIRELGIVVGDTHQEIRDAVGDGSRFGVRVTYLQQEAPLGLAHAVLIAEEFMAGEPFVMYLGDNLVREPLGPLVERFATERPDAQIFLARVPNPEQFGVAELDGDRVVRLVEKPSRPPSDLALVGVYMFDRTMIEAVKAIRPSARGELEITDAIQWLIDQGHTVRPYVISGWWKDTGKLEDMLEANRIILDTLAPRAEGRVEVDDVFRGPALESEAATLTDREVRDARVPTVLDAGDVDDAPGPERRRVAPLEKAAVIVVRDEADLLALGLLGHWQPPAGGQRPHLVEIAHGRSRLVRTRERRWIRASQVDGGSRPHDFDSR